MRLAAALAPVSYYYLLETARAYFIKAFGCGIDENAWDQLMRSTHDFHSLQEIGTQLIFQGVLKEAVKAAGNDMKMRWWLNKHPLTLMNEMSWN